MQDPREFPRLEPAARKPRRKKKKAAPASGKPQLVQVHVNVVNTANGESKKKDNEADSALKSLRGY